MDEQTDRENNEPVGVRTLLSVGSLPLYNQLSKYLEKIVIGFCLDFGKPIQRCSHSKTSLTSLVILWLYPWTHPNHMIAYNMTFWMERLMKTGLSIKTGLSLILNHLTNSRHDTKINTFLMIGISQSKVCQNNQT